MKKVYKCDQLINDVVNLMFLWYKAHLNLQKRGFKCSIKLVDSCL